MRCLKGNDDTESIAQMAKVTKAIAEAAKNNFKKVADELSKMKTEESKLDARQVWRLKKKLCPKASDAPTAMNDAAGNLIHYGGSDRMDAILLI